MESISETIWDVVLSGTGISQSLLALALSRSGKKVLHVDKNDYYGGAEAALSLQEVKAWARHVSHSSPFTGAAITHKPDPGSESKLGFSRAYNLSLSPQLIYTRSNLLPALISSKVYQQLEFLAVGSWWIYNGNSGKESGQDDSVAGSNSVDPPSRLQRIPGGREDVFGDTSIDLRSKRALMRFLKLAADVESHPAILEQWGGKSFPEFLTAHAKIPMRLQPPLIALTLSPDQPEVTTTSYALPRIHRHLTSIGVFGPGFGSVMPRWGGLAEVAQVACRALAVGGGVYVLDNGVKSIRDTRQQSFDNETSNTDDTAPPLQVRLDNGEEIRTHWIVGNLSDLPSEHRLSPDHTSVQTSHTISIVSSPLSSLFPLPSEGSPPPAGALVVYPTASLSGGKRPPVYLMVHSSDTGECPAGQCVIYASISHTAPAHAFRLLNMAVQSLLSVVLEDPKPDILWSVQYIQEHAISKHPSKDITSDLDDLPSSTLPNRILQLPDLSPGLVVEDDLLRTVRDAWEKITGGDGEFMQFAERPGLGDEDEDM